MQFFTPHLASWLRTRRFSEPTFRPSGATNIGKTKCFATFLPLRTPGSSFFWCFLFLIFFLLLFSSLLLPSLPFPSLLFSSLTFSDSSHLCFSSVHIVGSLTLKLPSNVYVYTICVYYIYIVCIYTNMLGGWRLPEIHGIPCRAAICCAVSACVFRKPAFNRIFVLTTFGSMLSWAYSPEFAVFPAMN